MLQQLKLNDTMLVQDAESPEAGKEEVCIYIKKKNNPII